jgi:NADPH:quinone reductase-like Zn-dependent oxidoreductase
MRQVWISRRGGPEVLQVRAAPDPGAGRGEVRIRVRAAGVNFADLMARRGTYLDAPKLPFVPGYEVAGEIDEVGEGVHASRVGERVLALTRFGGYSDVVCVPSAAAWPIPSSMPFAEAASIPVNWLTAWHMLVELCNVHEGHSVLVHAAAGGLGVAAVQIARRANARVLGTASAAKHERLRELGVSDPIDYRARDFETEVKRLTSGRGVDIVLDPLGGSSVRKSFASLAPAGRLVLYGASSTSEGPLSMLAGVARMGAFWPASLMLENRGVLGVNLLRLASEQELLAREMRDLLHAFGEGRFRPVVDSQVPFEDAPRAHLRVERRENFGKVVLLA